MGSASSLSLPAAVVNPAGGTHPGEARGQGTPAAVDQPDMPSTSTHPYWTIESARPRGLFRRRRLLLVEQTRPECVGWWLDEYLRENPWDHTFSELRVLEHPLEGIAPLEIERPRGFLDYFRDPLAGVTYHPDLHEPVREELYA